MGRVKAMDKAGEITFACSVGLMKYGAKKIISARAGSCVSEPMGFFNKLISKIKSVVSEYF